jgi:hypothetical protein
MTRRGLEIPRSVPLIWRTTEGQTFSNTPRRTTEGGHSCPPTPNPNVDWKVHAPFLPPQRQRCALYQPGPTAQVIEHTNPRSPVGARHSGPMERAFSPPGINHPGNLGRWPRLVWFRAVGPRNHRRPDPFAREELVVRSADPAIGHGGCVSRRTCGSNWNYGENTRPLPPRSSIPSNAQTISHRPTDGLQRQRRALYQPANDRSPDLFEHAPADNGGWTFLSTNPESKRGLESPRSVPPASSANGAPHTSLGQRPRSSMHPFREPCRGAPCRTDGTGLQPF